MREIAKDTIKEAMQSHSICVLIPTYNNAGTLAHVLTDVLKYSSNVIVVNDGSTDETSSILDSFSDKIHIVSYPANKGKGGALKAGFNYAISKGFEYAITIDSDGQHYVSDLPLMIKTVIENPQSLIVGERDLSNVDINGKSSFANKFSNFWFTVQTGKRLKDTQTGYRVYPLKHLHGLSILTNRYEAELELLVFAAWNGVKIISVPIHVYYPPQSERVSHFKPALDFTRISILNTILCFGAILYGIPARIWSKFKDKRFFSKESTWFTKKKGQRRDASLTLERIIRSTYGLVFFLFWSCLVFTPYVVFIHNFGRNSEKKKLRLHKMLQWISQKIVRLLPGTNITIEGIGETDFEEPKLIVCNHQSHIDLPVIMSLHPKIVFLTNDWVWHNAFFGKIVQEAEFLPVSAGIEEILPKLENLKSRGYSLVIFPEGTRSEDDNIQRFHQGAFFLAQKLGLDIKPLVLHGAGYYLRKHDAPFRRGDIDLKGLPIISQNDLSEIPLRKQASYLRKLIRDEYAKIASVKENAEYYKSLVLYKYAYRGWKIVSTCKNVLSFDGLSSFIDNNNAQAVRILNSGYGIFALLYALVNKGTEVYAFEEDLNKHDIAVNTANLPKNLHFVHSVWGNEVETVSSDKTISLQGAMAVSNSSPVIQIPINS